jgi:outer membrane protein TolC
VSWPIFDGLKTHYRVREANSELKIATTQDLQLKANVASDVINTRATYDEAVKRESSQKKALGLAQKAVDIATVRFREGLMSQLELNDTILQRDQSDKLYAQAVYDCLEAEANIVRVVGGSL